MERRRARGRKVYEDWMEAEGIPVFRAAAGVDDVAALPRRPWARTGGLGTFIELEGTQQAGKLMYVAEIPGGEALEPERHLFDELIYVLRGRGLTQIWQPGQSKQLFEWGEGSLFAIPLNAWHRLVNGGREPVLLFCCSNAPVLMEAIRDPEFLFNCEHAFLDRYSGQADYFAAKEERYKDGPSNFWETNFVPDLRTARLEDMFQKVEGGQLTGLRMAAWTNVHASEWPVGRYHKAHYHGPGAVILGLTGVGYALVWPKSAGVHPFKDGHGDQVVRVNWGPGSIYSPQSEWFHQHFNTGPSPARQLRVTGGGTGFGQPRGSAGRGLFISVRDGGSLIEYEDEDPEIRRGLCEELLRQGVQLAMAPVTYRTDPIPPLGSIDLSKKLAGGFEVRRGEEAD